MKPIAFIDIDGVLTTIKQFNINKRAKTYLKKHDVYPFDVKCVKILNEILNEIDFDIIVSSNWQYYFTLEELQDIFKINKVNVIPIGITNERKVHFSSSRETDRIDALERYIKENDVDKYIIIDDLDLSTESWSKSLIYSGFSDDVFVRCPNKFEGIKQSGIKDKILKTLKK